MFEKILIANRGEIACRIIKSAKKMGIKTVAIYSDADAMQPHVKLADEAYDIGASQASESYLNADKIIDVCIKSGAQAIHPGYGFLSENTEFAEKCAAHHIVFIGPPAHAIKAMGDKIASKNIAIEASVNCIPGYNQEIESESKVCSICQDIGYPVMLKASAGGGGKGMRLAYNDQEAITGYRNARSEAMKSFGDDRIFIEKFIEQPRHIEIQILGDQHGNIIYLGERECSLQRRHQKVIEEAPSSFIDEKTRQAMGKQAIMLAQKVDYYSAGTIEFIMDKNKNFYFLEMNTRLQVEHPVTEYVTNIDLVEWMIKIAYGESLSMKQDAIRINGASIECRIYAEDSKRGFLPSTGRITKYKPPLGMDNVRVDTGVAEGSEISVFYDPMIAKLITYGETRQQAIKNMRNALNAYVIDGVSHNIPFLSHLLLSDYFIKGNTTTNLIGDHFPDGLQDGHLIATGDQYHAMIALHILVTAISTGAHILPSCEFSVFDEYVAEGETTRQRIDVTLVNHVDTHHVMIHEKNGKTKNIYIASEWKKGQSLIKAYIDDDLIYAKITRLSNNRHDIVMDGKELHASVLERRIAKYYEYMHIPVDEKKSNNLLAPMPGVIVDILVSEGQNIKKNEPLFVMEAMKMENILLAEKDTTIDKIMVKKSEQVMVDQVICDFIE